uniref:variable large family protein n=1 Tax=Borrelia hispanica TaxID=40835 RepID=UPI0004662893|nr:variable large family protein [Borrelia hispanica]
MVMVMMVVMGCNSGGVKGEGTGGGDGRGLSGAMMEVGRSAENAFYAFMGLIADTLGFTAKATTKKSEVGEYFSSLGAKLGEASAELEAVARKSEGEGSKDKPIALSIRSAVEVAKGVLSTLKGHLDFLKGIGDSSLVGEVKSDNKQGVAANTDVLKKVHHALTGIIKAAKTEGIEDLKESKLTLGQASIGGTNPENGAKVLATSANATEGDSGKAAAIVSAVSGEEILESIVKSGEEKAVQIGAAATAETTPLEFAVGGTAANLAKEAAKAAAVAGGIALRALVKEGKLAAHNGNSDEKAVQSAGVTAANKLLVAVEDVIKKIVKNVLGKVKQEVDKARESKTVGQQ